MKAFPSEFWVKNKTNKGETTLLQQENGMDLRDYFAIKILQGYISYAGWHPDFEMAFPQEYAEKGKTADVLPNVCYRFADAMMKAREK